MVGCLGKVALQSKSILFYVITEECIDATSHVDDMVEFLWF